MRPKERIPVFLSLVDWETLSERWGVDVDMFNVILTNEGKLRETIVNFWLKHPDLRFGQLLINMDLMPDRIKIWMDEESSILDDQGIPRREFVQWGRNYDENHNYLPEIEWILIKDMTTDHINAILKDVAENRMNIKQYYKELFETELKSRQSK
jgi:hypothetical protein